MTQEPLCMTQVFDSISSSSACPSSSGLSHVLTAQQPLTCYSNNDLLFIFKIWLLSNMINIVTYIEMHGISSSKKWHFTWKMKMRICPQTWQQILKHLSCIQDSVCSLTAICLCSIGEMHGYMVETCMCVGEMCACDVCACDVWACDVCACDVCACDVCVCVCVCVWWERKHSKAYT